MPVRTHAAWLSQADERVLELLDDEGPLRPREIRARLAAVSPALAMPADAVDARCDVLGAHGLLDHRSDGAVELTSTGRGFLDGSVDLHAGGTRHGGAAPDDASADDYWVCPDCRWIGERRDLDADDACPVCGNASEYLD